MSESLRSGENFLRKLAALIDGIALEMDQIEDEEMRKEAFNVLWGFKLYFCKLTQEAMKSEELAGEISPVLRGLAEECVESPFFGALCGMLSVEHEDPPIRIPTDLVERVNLETLERTRDSLEEEVVEKIERESVKGEEENRMWG